MKENINCVSVAALFPFSLLYFQIPFKSGELLTGFTRILLLAVSVYLAMNSSLTE
jgi:hypothetical protein